MTLTHAIMTLIHAIMTLIHAILTLIHAILTLIHDNRFQDGGVSQGEALCYLTGILTLF
jgi:hypothetical protein